MLFFLYEQALGQFIVTKDTKTLASTGSTPTVSEEQSTVGTDEVATREVDLKEACWPLGWCIGICVDMYQSTSHACTVAPSVEILNILSVLGVNRHGSVLGLLYRILGIRYKGKGICPPQYESVFIAPSSVMLLLSSAGSYGAGRKSRNRNQSGGNRKALCSALPHIRNTVLKS